MLSFNEFQAESRRIFCGKEYSVLAINPIAFLYSLEWDIPNGEAFSEEDVARMNVVLDERGCFGRAVKAACLAEKYFPNETIEYAEVCEDLLRNMLMQKVTQANWCDDTYIAEILQYENPHLVIVCNNLQFDPIFSFLTATPEKLKHPAVKKQNLWNGLYASYLVSYGLLAFKEKQDTQTYLRFLDQAEILCPEMILLKENRASALCALESFDESIALAKQLVGERKDVKILFFLWTLTEDIYYKDQIIEQYDVKMFYFLTKMFMS